MDELQMLVGAALFLAGFVSSGVVSRLRRPKPPKLVEPICGCTHHLAKHDRETGECHAVVDKRRPMYKNGGLSHYEDVLCTCRQYVGPEPFYLSWTPPMALPESDTK